MMDGIAASVSAVGGVVADTEHGTEKTHGVVEHPHSSTAVEEHHEQIPHERPEDWGWHAESGKVARGGGWVCVVILLLLNIGNQTRHNENVWLIGIAVFMAILLLVDRHRRKNSWRG
jgi:hypothetical protein